MYLEREKKESERDAFRVFSRKDTFLTFLLRCDRGKRADHGKFFALLSSFALFGGVKAHSSSSRLLVLLLLLLLLLCVCARVFCSVKLSSHRVFFPPTILKPQKHRSLKKFPLRFRGKEKAALLPIENQSRPSVKSMKISASLSPRCFYLSKRRRYLSISPPQTFLIQIK